MSSGFLIYVTMIIIIPADFMETRLYELHVRLEDNIFDTCFQILDYSIYSTQGFLIVSYDSPASHTPQDGFNVYHSSA